MLSARQTHGLGIKYSQRVCPVICCSIKEEKVSEQKIYMISGHRGVVALYCILRNLWCISCVLLRQNLFIWELKIHLQLQLLSFSFSHFAKDSFWTLDCSKNVFWRYFLGFFHKLSSFFTTTCHQHVT